MKTRIIHYQDWICSPLFESRFYGGCKIGEADYHIVGAEKDLVRKDFVMYYDKLGRDSFISLLRANLAADDKTIKNIMKRSITERKQLEKEKLEQFEKRQTTLDLCL